MMLGNDNIIPPPEGGRLLTMLKKIEKNFSVEFMANAIDVREEISKGMVEEGMVGDDLAYVMRRKLGLISDSEHVRFWSEYAFETNTKK